jgi:hypothetical protein
MVQKTGRREKIEEMGEGCGGEESIASHVLVSQSRLIQEEESIKTKQR